jgi:hypothetical protein
MWARCRQRRQLTGPRLTAAAPPHEQLAGRGLPKLAIAVICGLRKPWRTTFTAADYADVRRRSDAYRTQIPRRIAT